MMDKGARRLSDVVCHLGEGPTYDAATNTLFWFDILGRKLVEFPFPDGPARVHDLPFMASALFTLGDGRHLVFAEDGFHLRDPATGALTLHTPVEADRPGNRSNDARVHPSGSIWAGTMGKGAESRAGAIYWFRKGEVRRLFPEITIPNSICFSPDGETGYFADTRRNLLFKVDCDPESGLPVGEVEIFLDHKGMAGGIDGSVVDADGVLWNARWGSARVDAYAPDGTHLRSVAVPARQASCPVFVGPALDRLAVTTAHEGMDDAARATDPQAGATFMLDIEVRGRAEPHALL